MNSSDWALLDTPVTVLPAYRAIFGPSSDSELGLGLEIWQGILSFITLALLAAVIISAAAGEDFPAVTVQTRGSND